MFTLAQSTHKHRIRVSDDARYLTIGQVRERFCVSDMWVWRHMRDHGFPRPVQFGGPTSARHWLLTDIERWERSKAVERLDESHDCTRKGPLLIRFGRRP